MSDSRCGKANINSKLDLLSSPRRIRSSATRESQRYDGITKKLNQVFLKDFTIFQHTPQWKKRILIQRAVFRKLCKHCGYEIIDKDNLPDAKEVLGKLKEMLEESESLAEAITKLTVDLLPEKATTGRIKETFTQKLYRIFNVDLDDTGLDTIIPYLIPEIFVLLK